MEKVLVTGGAGFIGSNLVHELVSQGIEVKVLDSLYLGKKSNLEGVIDDIEFIEGSVMDRKTVEEAVKDCDTVFHQAARSSSPMHNDNPQEGARVNIEGFINTVEASIQEGVEKIVYASTSSMYGSVKPPHTENTGEVPTNLYTASKMSRERYAESYSYNEKIQTTGLRYFAVYGPREKPKGKYANIVTQFLWKIQNDESPVIWGEGNQTRDFTFVKDIVKANILAAKRKDETDGEFYNIGTGQDHSFNKVVERINKELGKDIDPKYVENPREKYVEKTKANISKAEKDLGYKPEFSLEEGIRRLSGYYS